MQVAEAVELTVRAIDGGYPANSYLVVGDIKPTCEEFVDAVLMHIFADAAIQIENRTHPDVFYVLPSGKSRTIHSKLIKDELVKWLPLTAYSGGWKAVVVYGADRMEPEAVNAMLKELEEPPPQTIFFLLTDSPEDVLPTVVSRSQRVDLPCHGVALLDEANEKMAKIFGTVGVAGAYAKSTLAAQLVEILDKLESQVDDEDVQIVRRAFFRAILGYVREWMVNERLPRATAFRNLSVVQEAFNRKGRYMSTELVIGAMMDSLAFPGGRK